MALICIIPFNWVFIWSLRGSTFMSHATPLSLSKECIVHRRTVCLSGLVMMPSLFSCHPMFKGKLKKFTSTIKTVFMSVLFSQSYGYLIHIILELCSEFCFVDVGLIMALLRRDYSYRHQIIIQEIVIETNIVPWDLYASMTDPLALDIGSHHWPLIERFNWVVDIRSSIHTQRLY